MISRIFVTLIIWALFTTGLYVTSLNAQLPLTGAGKGAPGATAYVGPGDVMGAALAYWSAYRCYNAAYAGNVVDVYAPSDASHTLVTCSAGGTLNETLQSLATTCASSCTVKTLYDQTGNGFDMTAVDVSFRPVYNLAPSGLGAGKNGIRLTVSSPTTFLIAASMTQAQSFTASFVAEPKSDPSVRGDILDQGNAQFQFGFSNGQLVYLFAGGSVVTATGATTNVFHAVQTLVNGSSSSLYVDGSSTTGLNPGSTGLGSSIDLAATSQVDAVFCEAGIWAGDKSSNFSALNSNQHSYWGF